MITRSRRVMAGTAVVSLLASVVAVLGTATPAAAQDACDAANPELPTLNTWYDQQNNYRGTRLALRDQIYNLATEVYDTYGHGYRQIEVWDRGGALPPTRVSCERKEEEPRPAPEEPVISHGPAGSFETYVDFPSFHGVPIVIVGSSIPNGNVDVGDVEQIE